MLVFHDIEIIHQQWVFLVKNDEEGTQFFPINKGVRRRSVLWPVIAAVHYRSSKDEKYYGGHLC